MSMTTKNIPNHTSQSCLEEIERAFYPCVAIASTMKEVADIICDRKSKALVILVDFSADIQQSYEQFEKMITANRKLVWIALLERRHHKDDECRLLLSAYFYDFHTYPIDSIRLGGSVGHAIGMANFKAACQYSEPRATSLLIGQSQVMQELREKILRLSHCRLPVMVTGPTGTGKELVARELHLSSMGADHPFVAVNCGAIPAQLIQSELFGHVKGAFTGACERRLGKIEAANGGTLFLDEVGELPLEAQVVLLRFLEEGIIDVIGSNKPVKVDVRIIAATNIELEHSVAKGVFREDLYYRLNVVRLYTSPLCQRKEDILLLANHFLAEQRLTSVIGFSLEAQQKMVAYGWPGNVRELRNKILRATALCRGGLIDIDGLDLTDEAVLNAVDECDETLKSARQASERHLLLRMLTRYPEQYDEIAQRLDVSRATLYRLLQKYGLS